MEAPTAGDHLDKLPGWGKLAPFSPVGKHMLSVKIIIVVLLALILLSLGASLFSMVKDRENSNRAVKMLTVRIVLSVLTFIFIFIAFFMGWIQPHGVMPPS
jgi:ABC-type Na+ efflux pump permease subunit